MSQLAKLAINNFRGIKELNLDFAELMSPVCLLGRGDAGKTTVLNAIFLALSPRWNESFWDTDFYNCDHSDEIAIRVTIINPPEDILTVSKFGLYMRGYDNKSKILIDDLVDEDLSDRIVPAITVKLTVDASLEPKWVVESGREQEDKPISANDRAKFNCYFVSDYVDRHFSWNKGNPLYTLLQENNLGDVKNKNIVIDCMRSAIQAIDSSNFDSLDKITEIIKSQAAEIGLNIENSTTTLDSREVSIKDGRVSLHQDNVPFRMMGKGSKRLASMAIQMAIVRKGGILLIDEIEQGLEPDRIKHVVRAISDLDVGQVIFTTHSRDAIVELDCKHLLLLINDNKKEEIYSKKLGIDNLQGTIRACPEAFYAENIIVCEGDTEIGICRAIDSWRKRQGKEQMSLKNCAFIDGRGNNMDERVDHIRCSFPRTAVICDSDDSKINEKKKEWHSGGVAIFDCEDDMCIEQQIFKDAPWVVVIKLLEYAKDQNQDSFNSKFSEYKKNDVSEWQESEELRNKIVDLFKKKSNGKSGTNWYKSIRSGEEMGDIVLAHLNKYGDTKTKNTLNDLSNWIDNDK